jgi:hypothetical protein
MTNSFNCLGWSKYISLEYTACTSFGVSTSKFQSHATFVMSFSIVNCQSGSISSIPPKPFVNHQLIVNMFKASTCFVHGHIHTILHIAPVIQDTGLAVAGTTLMKLHNKVGMIGILKELLLPYKNNLHWKTTNCAIPFMAYRHLVVVVWHPLQTPLHSPTWYSSGCYHGKSEGMLIRVAMCFLC